MGSKREYADNKATRKSTLHWLGDREGKISAGAVSHYAGAMVGFDRINGIYNTEQTAGTTKLTISSRVWGPSIQ